MLNVQLREDLNRIAALAANVAEAHTAALFLPAETTWQSPSSPTRAFSPVNSSSSGRTFSPLMGERAAVTGERVGRTLELVASHSLSNFLLQHPRIGVGSGIVGWVAENSRPIHVAPFDLDTSALAIYSEAESLKSVIALPISVPALHEGGPAVSGVLMCDTKKAFAFTKVQVKNLEEIASLTSRLLFWSSQTRGTATESSMESFLKKTDLLGGAIGHDSIEIIRITTENLSAIEASSGITVAVQKMEQFTRLVQQALPPHFPVLRLPNGEILIAVDNMMATFFQNKVRTLASHLSEAARSFTIRVQSYSAKSARGGAFNIDAILRAGLSTTTSTLGKVVGGSHA